MAKKISIGKKIKILRLWKQGFSRTQIAKQCEISESTVERHISNYKAKKIIEHLQKQSSEKKISLKINKVLVFAISVAVAITITIAVKLVNPALSEVKRNHTRKNSLVFLLPAKSRSEF